MPTGKQKADIQVVEELEPRWAKFVDLYLHSGNAFQSAITAGFSEEYARVITTRFPEKVRNSLKDALDNIGVTPVKIAEKIDALLEATTPIYKNNNETGQVEFVGDKPDYQAIDKGITHAMKIGVGGGYAPEKSVSLNANVNITPQDEKAKAIAQKFEEELLASIQT